MDSTKIPAKSEWQKLSIAALYDVKSDMMEVYYNMRSSNASFANQYMTFVRELDALIQRREREAFIESQAALDD